jgi:glycerol-3-phosphate acyltransferase PlsY
VSTPLLLAALALGYLLGSIPFGVLLTRAAGLGDVRRIGSGNIGTTNVLRTGRKDLAAATLLGDMLKGTAAVLIAARWGEAAAIAAGIGAFFGHLFPVWLRFRGGKGVATYLGILIGLCWPAALGFALVWIAVAAAAHFSSLAALAASLVAPPLVWLDGAGSAAALACFGLTVLLWLTHRDNIRRLAAGTEGRIGQRAGPPPAADDS